MAGKLEMVAAGPQDFAASATRTLREPIRLPEGAKEDAEHLYVPTPDGQVTKFVKGLMPAGLLNRLVRAPPKTTPLSPTTQEPVTPEQRTAADARMEAPDFDTQLANYAEALRAPAGPAREATLAAIRARIAAAATQPAPAPKAPVKSPPSAPAKQAPKPEDFRVLDEDDSHFLVQRDNQAPFKIAKQGLRPQLLAQIQGFADGGVVEDEDPTVAFLSRPDAGVRLGGADAGAPSLASGVIPPEAVPAALQTPAVEPPGLIDRFLAGLDDAGRRQQDLQRYTQERDKAQRERAAAELGGAVDWIAENAPSLAGRPDPERAELARRGLMAAPEAPTPTAAVPERSFALEAPPVAPEAVPAEPSPAEPGSPESLAQRAPPVGGGPGGGGGATAREIAAGTALQEQAIAEQAAVAAQTAAQKAALYDQYLADRAQLEADSKQRLAEHQTRGQELYDAVLNSKIDPNRHWRGMGVGQAASSIVGMILGSIGAANNGQNAVVALIDRAIERDIDAQKSELGKKQNLLSWHLQQGRDMQAAMQLVKADKMEMFAAQLQRAASQAEGPEAAAKALQQVGILRTGAAKERQQATYTDLQMQLARQAAALKAKEDAKSLSELAVPIGPGRIAYGLDKEATKKAREMAGAHESFIDALDQVIGWRKRHGAEVVPGEAKAEGDSLLADLKIAYNHAKGLGALDKGSMEILDKIFGESASSVGFVLSRLEGMRRAAQRGFERRVSPYLMPMQAPTSGLRKER